MGKAFSIILDQWFARCEEAPSPGAPEVTSNHLSTLSGLQNTQKLIYYDAVALLVNLKTGVDEGHFFFFIFLQEKASSNILNKKLMRNNKVENEH